MIMKPTGGTDSNLAQSVSLKELHKRLSMIETRFTFLIAPRVWQHLAQQHEQQILMEAGRMTGVRSYRSGNIELGKIRDPSCRLIDAQLHEDPLMLEKVPKTQDPRPNRC